MWAVIAAAMVGLVGGRPSSALPEAVDVLVYGATPGGVAAAVAARRGLGSTGRVVVVEPWLHVGGMLAAGMVDDSTVGNTRAYGGIALEYAHRVAAAYNATDPAAACFHGEPHVVEGVFRQWLLELNISLHTGQSLARVTLSSDNTRVASITLAPAGATLVAGQFIDASYEGDLLAQAGVPTVVGRESAQLWGESMAGQVLCSNRSFDSSGYEAVGVDVNTSVHASDPALFPPIDGVYPSWSQAEGSARNDTRVQSFNFRACLTKASSGAEIAAPAGYDPANYTLVARYIAALSSAETAALSLSAFFGCSGYLGGKCDTNDGTALGINPMGEETYRWPTASAEERQGLRQRFVDYTLGLWWFLGHDNRVPAQVQSEMRAYRLCGDEWTSAGEDHLPFIPYVREARRMQSDNVFTQEDYRRRANASLPGQFESLPPGTSGIHPDSPLDFSIGLGFWFIDSHAVRRVSVGGLLRNEGCVQYGRSQMAAGAVWEMPFGVLTPPPTSPANLLAVCAISATHIGYQPFRVEPTFMVLGQAAGTAGALAITTHSTPRTLGMEALQAALSQHGAILSASGMPPNPAVANCAAGPPPPPPPPPPSPGPPPPTPAVVAMDCASAPNPGRQWEVGSDGSLRKPGMGGACLTALPRTPEPTAGHGVAVGLASCPFPTKRDTQRWVPKIVSGDATNRTIVTAVSPPPHCFGTYNGSECQFLTALAWEKQAERTVMLWQATNDSQAHPQRWTYRGTNGEPGDLATVGTDPALCLVWTQ